MSHAGMNATMRPMTLTSARSTKRLMMNVRGGAHARAYAVVRCAQANGNERGAEAVGRRAAMARLSAAVALASGGAGVARADVGDYLANLLVEKPPPPKREIMLPELIIEPYSREDGCRATSGASKAKAQIEFAQFIAPIIEDNIDLTFGEYFRLALADFGTFSVVGKKNGLNGSVRFELDRPENKGLKKAFASIEKIKKAVDAKTDQPVSYADLIALVPHFAARVQFKKDYIEEVGSDKDYEFLFIGTNPFLGPRCASVDWTPPPRIPKV